ncbi:hypothetical protein D9M72_579140 [compost metagenome]
MLRREVGRCTAGFAIDDEVYLALSIEQNVFGAMTSHQRKAQRLKNWFQRARHGRSEFHKLESHQPHRVATRLSHSHT